MVLFQVVRRVVFGLMIRPASLAEVPAKKRTGDRIEAFLVLFLTLSTLLDQSGGGLRG